MTDEEFAHAFHELRKLAETKLIERGIFSQSPLHILASIGVLVSHLGQLNQELHDLKIMLDAQAAAILELQETNERICRALNEKQI